MTEATETEQTPPKRRGRLPLIVGAVLAVVAGAGGYAAVTMGLLFGTPKQEAVTPLPPIAFVPIDPLVISLEPGARSRHLRFAAQLEVGSTHAAEVTTLMPRIVDVLNGYLRAISVAELEDRAALVRLRSQMLRRIQIVTGEGRVRDLLITEFVLN